MSRLRKITPAVWGQVVLAGLLAGLAFAGVMMIVNWRLGEGFCWYANTVAAVWPPLRPAGHDLAWVPTLVGLATHLIVSVLLALVYTALVLTWAPHLIHHWGHATWLGMVVGMLLWLGFGLWLTPFVDPAMLRQVPELYYSAHLVFGMALVWLLAALVPQNEIAVAFERARERPTHP
ncbi:MAG TPA: hypothetical protein V6D47_20880 [Oscillatoriaceae cyanobacterium]